MISELFERPETHTVTFQNTGILSLIFHFVISHIFFVVSMSLAGVGIQNLSPIDGPVKL
jgi:hypothetical protein